MKKVITVAITLLFLINNISYALSPELGSNCPDTRGAMYAGAQKLWQAKVGPGGTWLDRVFGRPSIKQFIGKDTTEDIKIWFKKEGEGIDLYKNPIFKKQNLIEALEYYRDYEACIPIDFLEIKEGYYELEREKDGELPLARIETYYDRVDSMKLKSVLIVHAKLVQMWNHIRENDILFEHEFEDGRTRIISLAWGIFYRIAKHEMADLSLTRTGTPKGGGHYKWGKFGSFEIGGEEEANEIGGRYNIVNDTIWLWFLQSYCFYDSTRYNNNIFDKRLSWIFHGLGKKDSGNICIEQFPNFREKVFYGSGDAEADLKFSKKLALAINYHFFSRKGVEMPKLTVAPEFIEDYKNRKDSIIDRVVYAGGTDGEKNSLIKDASVPDIIEHIKTAIPDSALLPEDILAEVANGLKEAHETQALSLDNLPNEEIHKVIAKVLEGELDLNKEIANFEKGIQNSGGVDISDEDWNEIQEWQEWRETAEKSIKSIIPSIETILDYTAPVLNNQGPGQVKMLDETKRKEVWQGVNSLHENDIEILIPQSIKLTNDMETKLVETKQAMKKIGRTLLWDRYRPETLIEKLKENKSQVRRIVLADDALISQIYGFIDTSDDIVELFRDVKLLNIKLPETLSEIQQTEYQMHLLMTAILVRLFEEGDMYFNDIRLLLTDILEGCFDAGSVDINTFINALAVKEDNNTSIEKIKKRIEYFLITTPAISLIEKLQIERETTQEFFKYL